MQLTLREVHEQLEYLIAGTPTGLDREDLTTANIYLLRVIDRHPVSGEVEDVL
jgi:hypothetical protein